MEPAKRTLYWLLALAIAAISVSSTLMFLATREAPPLAVAFYRLLFATLILSVPAIATARREDLQLSLKDHAVLFGIGLMLAVHFATWITSILYTSVASSIVLVTTEAIWIPIGAHFLLKERVGKATWWGILVAFIGSVVLVSGDAGETRFGPNALIGDFLALAAALAASGYFLAGRKMRQRMSITTYATIVYAWSTLILFVFVMTSGQSLGPFAPMTFLWLGLFAIIPMILGHTVINYILRWVRAHIVSTAILVEPLVSAVLALLLFAQSPSPLVWLGGGIVLTGILLATRGEAHPPAPEVPAEPWGIEH